MITFDDLANAAPQISEKLLTPMNYLHIGILVFCFAVVLYLVYALIEYLHTEHKRRLSAPWIPIMEDLEDRQLQDALNYLVTHSKLPTSFYYAKAKSLDEAYDMVDDFMRICRKRGIK